MAKSLKIQIEMAGAEEIKAQLEGVGKAGEQAFQKIIAAAKEAGGFNKLDPGVVTKSIEDLGVKGPAAIDKITQAVKSAGRMETLVNALTGVENGLAKIQSAASAVDNVLGKQLIRSITLFARLLPAAFAAGTVGAIASATQELLRLSDAALKAGISIADLAKAEGIFRAVGASAKEAAAGAASFQEQMDLKNVKEAIANLDEFGRSASTQADWLKILEEASKGSGEAAKLATEHLAKMGRVRVSGPAQDIDRITKSAASVPDKILAMLGVFEKMGNTTDRNRLIFANFDKTMAGFIIRMLDAGVSVADIKKEMEGMPKPTQAAVNAATLLALEWERLKRLFTSNFGFSPESLGQIATTFSFIRQLVDAIGTGLTIVGNQLMKFAFVAGTLNFGNTLSELQAIGSALTSIGNLAMSVWNGFVQAASTATNAVLQFFTSLPGQIASFFTGLGSGLWNGLVQGAQAAVQTVLQFFAQLPGQIAGFFAGFGANLWEGIVSSAQAAWDTVVGFIQTAINKVKEFFSMGGGQAAGAGAQGMARGGLMGGRGSGTSDSNLAWLSRGEHVMPAYAVRQPGVLQLLEALRRSGGNLRGVLDRMGHFAMGGMVSAPAFARGGAVSGMSNVTIQFPGVQPITGLRASSAVVDELRRSAALAQVRSGGRKPSRYS